VLLNTLKIQTERSLRDREADRHDWSTCRAGNSDSRHTERMRSATSGRARSAGTCPRSAAGTRHTVPPLLHRLPVV